MCFTGLAQVEEPDLRFLFVVGADKREIAAVRADGES